MEIVMNFSNKLLVICTSAVLLMILSAFFEAHALNHLALALLGCAAGMLIGKKICTPKLKNTRIVMGSCSSANPAKASAGATCTVTVMRQYCYIVDTPVPQQICFWVKE